MNEAIIQYFTESLRSIDDRLYISRHEVEHDGLWMRIIPGTVVEFVEDLSLMAVRRIFHSHILLISNTRILKIVMTLNSIIRVSLRVQIRCSLRFIVV